MRRRHPAAAVLAAAFAVLAVTSCGVSRGDAAPGEPAVTVELAEGATFVITHGELNDLVEPAADNAEFAELVYQGEVPSSFTAQVANQSLIAEALSSELVRLGDDPEPTDANVGDAREILVTQLATLYPDAADPPAEAERLFGEVSYLPFLVRLRALEVGLTDRLAADAGDDEGNPCARHILVETEAEAETILADLDGGADFATLAMEHSLDGTGATGGELGCNPSAQYVPEFATALDGATEGEPVGPVQTEFGWHVLLIDGFEVDGGLLVAETMQASLVGATVTVDERVGEWDPTSLQIVPPVLDPGTGPDTAPQPG